MDLKICIVFQKTVHLVAFFSGAVGQAVNNSTVYIHIYLAKLVLFHFEELRACARTC